MRALLLVCTMVVLTLVSALLFCSGEVSNEMFELLCRLEHFDLSGNAGLVRSTLAGYLACTTKNLKDAKSIDAAKKGLKGEYVPLSGN